MYLKNIVEEVISKEIDALNVLKSQLDITSLSDLIERIVCISGKVIITGIGKSGIIAKKIVASLCSIGIGSIFLNPGDAAHGDMGVIGYNDLVIILSNSGQGTELKRIISYCNTIKVSIIGISQNYNSYLIDNSDISIILPDIGEVSDIAIPTTSSTMMLVFGDVLTIALKEKIQLKADQYSLYHPGGKIGLMYMKVKDLMIQGNDLPIVNYDTPLLDIMITIALKRLGFAIVIDDNGQMLGIVNPHGATNLLKANSRASNLMIHSYKTISGELAIADALSDLNRYNQLIVVKDGRPEGLLTSEIFNLKMIA